MTEHSVSDAMDEARRATATAQAASTTANAALAAIQRHEAVCDERQKTIIVKLETSAEKNQAIEAAVKAVHKRLDAAAIDKSSTERRVLLALLGLAGAGLLYFVARYGVLPVQN